LRIHYDRKLVEASGIDAGKFPDLVPCTEIIGSLTTEAAGQLGLLPSTPVVAGSVDVSAAAIGSGATGDREAHLYVGTSSWIGAHVARKKTDVLAQVAAVPCALPGRYLMIAMQSTAGAGLDFLKDRILANGHGSGAYERLDRIASEAPAGSRGLLFMPWLTGERTPVGDPNLRAGFLNLGLEHSHQEITRAVFEGVALNTRWMLPKAERFLGCRLREITMVGGGAKSDTWCQIFADVLGVRVRQPLEPLQANAVGAARIAGLGLKLLTVDGIASQTRIRRVFEPQAANVDTYERSFRTFRTAHKRLAPLYAEINGS
jgi:xylulokinase